MRTHVALVRGINVGGKNKVAMTDLREIVSSLGHTDVATYIQSGNVVFTSSQADTGKIAAELAEEIAGRLGLRPSVVVLSRAELARVIADNPYPHETSPKCLHVVFRHHELDPAVIPAVAEAQERASAKGSRDEATVVGRFLYLRTPDGLGRSELITELGRPGAARTAQRDGTARNWATVTKLMALLGD